MTKWKGEKRGMMDDIEHLNVDCTCITLDRDRLCNALAVAVGDASFCNELVTSRPHLVSAQPLFLTADHASAMQSVVRAIETVALMPAYREAVLTYGPEIAKHPTGPIGVFMGYDFHLGPTGPKLIEINTNAGGALINAYLLHAQQACCAEMALSASTNIDLEARLSGFVESFNCEWRKQGKSRTLQTIAIVDDEPRRQYLYPEFVLFQRLFEAHGISATIAAPEELSQEGGKLWHGNRPIDLVYNRLTDFDLSRAEHVALRTGYLAGDVAVTPNPWAHALYADKRNLVLLSDKAILQSWDVPDEIVDTMNASIPRTILVTPSVADELWDSRSQLFFKPFAGYGGKAAYRGDKITRKVWNEILAGNYVAQDIVPPSSRNVAIDGKIESLKADLRCYTYAGTMQLLAARLYRGLTTNFRTPGGGFAPVFIGKENAECHC